MDLKAKYLRLRGGKDERGDKKPCGLNQKKKRY